MPWRGGSRLQEPGSCATARLERHPLPAGLPARPPSPPAPLPLCRALSSSPWSCAGRATGGCRARPPIPAGSGLSSVSPFLCESLSLSLHPLDTARFRGLALGLLLASPLPAPCPQPFPPCVILTSGEEDGAVPRAASRAWAMRGPASSGLWNPGRGPQPLCASVFGPVRGGGGNSTRGQGCGRDQRGKMQMGRGDRAGPQGPRCDLGWVTFPLLVSISSWGPSGHLPDHSSQGQ